MTMWKSVKDELPEVYEEVFVLNDDEEISFGHIVNSEHAISYNGWNIPNVAFWRPCEYTEEMFNYYGYEDCD